MSSDTRALVLKGTTFPQVDTLEIIEQIESRTRSEKKLPTWYSSKGIYYPNKLNIEQTSSETTAKYKARLVDGHNLIDITGGFGVDSFYFSKNIQHVTHCELNPHLSQIVSHNIKQLKVKNISCFPKDGMETLISLNTPFDWIYIDPSRRDDSKGKVFLLKDCLPNVPDFLELFFKYSKKIMIKTSPLLDLSMGINELQAVKAIHIVAVKNEVKELLWILERDFTGVTEIKTVNIQKESEDHFDFYLNEESQAVANLSEPLTYLYEPNAAILKGGAFEILAEKLQLSKLHKHSHLYTSKKLIAFPGRRFKVEHILPYNKKQFKRVIKVTKANVATRNFPETVQQIRKKLGLSDGGNDYLFFTTNLDNKKIIIACKKV